MLEPRLYSLDTTTPQDYEPPYALWSAMNLTELANHFCSDKGSIKHNYTQIYEKYFSPLRIDPYTQYNFEPMALLEIGVACGASLKMWARYFSHANITGCDINPLCASLCKDYENINIVIQDAANNPVDGSWDIIIDDGSHVAKDMYENFTGHWGLVKPGGFYCIEDTGCTLPNRNYHRPGRLGNPEERRAYHNLLSLMTDFLDADMDVDFVHCHKELVIVRKK